MTTAELRYLIATNALHKELGGVKLTSIAERVGVSKVSVYRAVERLEKSGYVQRDEKNKVIVTPEGERLLEEYMVIVNFISDHLEKHCGTPKDTAYQDALGAACALSDISREGIAKTMAAILQQASES
ncbi:MAG: helix-turn-helix domain-containing protein [Clostridia bacterium]|nr:helix-turn-helix domain-containing protein [Clostridia bacterium]